MVIVPNLLIIAGTGTKSGKTSMACKIIRLFPERRITAIKITPHFHKTTPGLVTVTEGTGYSIYEETESNGSKDTSRMLEAGAGKVYFAMVRDNQLQEAFSEIMKSIPAAAPVICESPALRNFAEPGIFIIMTSSSIHKHKDISHLQILPHVMFKLEELKDIRKLPIEFKYGRWSLFQKETAI